MAQLKSYDTGEKVWEAWQAFEKDYQIFQQGKDPYADQQGPYRRAFLSQYDQTYQPYSIKLPENYDPQKKYPLLIFLHGSGSDDQGFLNQAWSRGNFIEVAPYARDMFFCYSSDSAQNDIEEAIEDVSRWFSVERDKIVSVGFSL